MQEMTGPMRHVRARAWASTMACLAALAAVGTAPAAGAAAPASPPVLPNDPMEPIADAAGANAGPLSGALIVTRDLDNLRRIYVDGVGLTLEGPLESSRATIDAQRRLWQMPPGMTWQTWRLTRPATPDAIRVLILVPDVDTPVMRRSYDREETGPYALGFAMRDVRAVDARITALGFRRTLPAVNEYPLQLRDGSEYPVIEASYEIADATRLVLMQRGGGLKPTGSIDAATGLGGPSYSSLIVEDAAAMQRFFTTVLDYTPRARAPATSASWNTRRPIASPRPASRRARRTAASPAGASRCAASTRCSRVPMRRGSPASPGRWGSTTRASAGCGSRQCWRRTDC